MDGGRIILDGFDNGIRHFDELPIALSSSLKGHDIVWYFRQNEFITLHDLICEHALPSTQAILTAP